MYWKILLMPVIGAVIGYVTNWIAVKMLFRPRREVFVFGKRLPFTPGVIPKGQGRLARAVGRAVEEQLLTREILEEVLLSDDKCRAVEEAVSAWLRQAEASDETIRKAAEKLISEEAVEDIAASAEEEITEAVYQKIMEMDPGRIVADKVLESVKEKLADSMFGMMLGDSILEPIAMRVGEKINEYLEENGRGLIEQLVLEESEKLQMLTVGNIFSTLERYELDIPQMVTEQYKKLVKVKLPLFLEKLSLSAIVEDRINRMDVMEVEALMLSIMKKELGAIVNLGALIGLLLGLVNAVILVL